MTISRVGAGTVVAGTTGPLLPAYPAGVAAGRVALLKVVLKPSTATITTPAGFLPFPNTNATGGTGAQGADTGPVRVAMFYKMLVGSETGTVSVALASTPNNAQAVIDIYDATNGFREASFAGTNGADAVNDTGWSITGAAALGLAARDWLVGCDACASNGAGTITVSARAVSATGATFGTIDNLRNTGSNSGNDSTISTWDAPVTGGSSTVAPGYTATHSAANSGVTAMARLVEYDAYLITTGSDDAHEEAATGAVTIDGTVMTAANVNDLLAVRFGGILMPAGAIIDAALLDLVLSDNDKNDAEGAWHCQATNDAPTFTTTATDISSRVRTTASVAWNTNDLGSSGTVVTPPDLKTALQEVINRPGWASGNSVVFIYLHNSGTDKIQFATLDHATLAEARLEVAWSAGTPPAVQASLVPYRSPYRRILAG
jgi:hypothetical protein